MNGPELPRASSAPTGDYLLAVSRLDPRRGATTLLDAWDIVHAELPELTLVMAGKIGWNVDDTVGRARRTPGVVLTGEVDQRDLASLYRSASALVTASVCEGFGLPVLEAMSFGTPVVASAIPPHLELASGAAEFFPPGDPAALAKAVLLVLGDETVRTRAREVGREKAALLTSERLAAEWTQVADAALLGTKG